MLNSEQFNQDDSQPEENVQPLTKGQKVGAAALAFFSFLVIVLWMIQFKNSIYSPFAYKGDDQAIDIIEQPVGNDDQALKLKDTDGDGLSDYDELNIYKISPYLADSDSDGFGDKEEVVSGNDPNCPQGKDCTGFDSAAPIPDTNSASSTAAATGITLDNLMQRNSQAEQIINSAASSSAPSQDDLQAYLSSGQISAAELRTMLLQAGMAKDVLDQIKDEDLLASFQEVLGQVD
jgi:hypothetical protein